jgi:hypothetical protein
MHVRSIRRITNDANHNAFTGCCWFKGSLYVAFRQGDAHADPQGKLLVLRSRDEGVTFDHVATIRGQFDTRDAHLFTDGERLYCCGFEYEGTPDLFHSGCSSTDNGLNWTPWQRYEGTRHYILWRPRFWQGKYYCAAYGEFATNESWAVAWFESEDGLRWKMMRELLRGPELPSECSFDFRKDGEIVMIVRRDFKKHTPLLGRSKPPYDRWEFVELNVELHGPVLWLVGPEIWTAGRWFAAPGIAHVGVFSVENNRPTLRCVLPSGPGFDCSYAAVSRFPGNLRRYAFSYYSNHTAPDDPRADQWSKTDIYLADIIFEGPFLTDWKVSDVMQVKLDDLAYPSGGSVKTSDLKATIGGYGQQGFVNADKIIQHRAGTLYFIAEPELGPVTQGTLHIGYDGPVRVWVNGEQVFAGPGTNPAIPDQTSVPVKLQHGRNRVVIALDTNGGKAQGVFGRIETEA